MLNNPAGAPPTRPSAFQVREPKTTALVVITADCGAAGAHNTNAARRRAAAASPPRAAATVAVGRKGDYLRRCHPRIPGPHGSAVGEASSILRAGSPRSSLSAS
jgi:F0F1-type ATP synthase gamma subunit